LGASIGDLLSGILSQILKSRKKTVVAFLIYSAVCVFIFLFLTKGWSNTAFYTVIFFMGFGRGYWAIFVTIAAEQFGTNLRATVTTTCPNFARGTLVPVTFLFTEMHPKMFTAPTTAALLAILCFGISLYCILSIEETFGKELNYLEMKNDQVKEMFELAE
jgi:putative MFS transporter